MSSSPPTPIRVGILGASGYTGGDLVRLLAHHPHVAITALTADRHAGKPLGAVFGHLGGVGLPDLARVEDVDWAGLDLVFCALPHGTTQEIVARLPGHLRIVDLSADFRLRDTATYAQWYGHAHYAPDLQPDAAYGLTELNRDRIRAARLVANPGCYPTATLLALQPLVEAGLVDPDCLIIDAKSGVTGAGRGLKDTLLFGEVAEGVHAYGVGGHRHMPEIEQELAKAAGRPVTISFTPHLVPMNRGEYVTCYVRLHGGADAERARAALADRYAPEPFVTVLDPGIVPQTRFVRGTNHCHIAVFADRRPGWALVIAAIDNLVKGSSGEAIQNMNVMLGLDETAALTQLALFP